MNERQPSPLEQNPEQFSKFYPQGEFSSVTLQDIPEMVQSILLSEVNKNSLNKNETKPVKFFQVKLSDGSAVFGARFNHEYPDPARISPAFYFYEFDNHGEEVGQGGARYIPSLGYPLVDYVETPANLRGHGIGTERYFLMSALCRMFFGKNLHSSTVIDPRAERIWEALYREGKAEIAGTYERDDGTHNRYRLAFPL